MSLKHSSKEYSRNFGMQPFIGNLLSSECIAYNQRADFACEIFFLVLRSCSLKLRIYPNWVIWGQLAKKNSTFFYIFRGLPHFLTLFHNFTVLAHFLAILETNTKLFDVFGRVYLIKPSFGIDFGEVLP
jgi:hypothetical protein